jgi:hypothetical protein
MKIRLQVVIEDDQKHSQMQEVITLGKGTNKGDFVGLSLEDSKHILKQLQEVVVHRQADEYTKSQRRCPSCTRHRRIKGYTNLQYRTLFGIVTVPNQRLYHCACSSENIQTFRVLNDWLPEHNSPELQYIEVKWASLMSYGMTVDLLKEVLPINDALSPETVRSHLHKVAKRQDQVLEDKPSCVSGCPNQWGALPKPGKPITVGIDGGYIRDWNEKKTNFEVIVGKSFSDTLPGKRLGFIQKLETNPQRRLLHHLNEQGMQANQQITFLSDGADNVRDLQYLMYPESEHLLDWFHVTMRLTVLNQFAKGVVQSDPDSGAVIAKDLEGTKWFLWHGNVENALHRLDNCIAYCDDPEIKYEKAKKFLKYLEEMDNYIRNNRHLIPNYGERYRYNEAISTGFVESTVNEVVAKRMVKKQQMQWTHTGAHCLLQTRTAVLNDELGDQFESWYPELKENTDSVPHYSAREVTLDMPIAAYFF